MNIHAVQGGAACHWGGPAALAEANAALHALMFDERKRHWHEVFHYVNDAGHAENGVYALRANYGFDGLTIKSLRGFRSIASKLTGHGESHLNPEGVFLSNGPLGSAFPQAQGLCMADKAIGNDRTTLCVLSDGAAMEGEAREALASIPGFAARGMCNPFVLIISDNNTKLSGRISDDAFNMTPTFETLETLGWHVLRVDNGHDLEKVYQSLELAIQTTRANPKQPVCAWLKTIKGYGIKATEENNAGGHGFPLKNGEKAVEWVQEIYGGSAPVEILDWARELRDEWEKKQQNAIQASPAATVADPSVKKTKIQTGLAAAALRAAQKGYPVVSIAADLAGSTGMGTFQKTFPGRSIDAGVAEANMISMGVGFAKAGFIPIVDTFAQFGVTKGNLPLTMASLSQAPVIAMFSHCGFQDAADGASHQATTYMAALSAIPAIVCVCLSCADEAEALVYEAIHRYARAREAGEDGETVVFFLGREDHPMRWQENAAYAWEKAQVLREGGDVVLVSCGSVLGHAIEAANILAKEGVAAAVVNNAFINRIDIKTIGPLLDKAGGKLVTLEDHQIVCGMGAQLTHALALSGRIVKARALGIRGQFGQSAYLADHLYAKHGMDALSMASAARELLR
jgi:transketolase